MSNDYYNSPFEITLKELASAQIVHIGDNSTVALIKNDNGSVTTFPLMIPAEPTEADFRISYYKALCEYHSSPDVKPLRLFRYTDSKGKEEIIVCGEELYIMLTNVCNLAVKQMEIDNSLKGMPKILRPLATMTRGQILVMALCMILGLANLIILLGHATS